MILSEALSQVVFEPGAGSQVVTLVDCAGPYCASGAANDIAAKLLSKRVLSILDEVVRCSKR